MSDPELMKKIVREARLTPEEERRLDEALAAQSAVRHSVAGLADDEPSMAWRSALNEKLLSATPKPRRNRWTRWLAPASGFAAGLAVAGLAWWVTATREPQQATPGIASFEAQLLQAHDHGAALVEFAPGSLDSPVARASHDEGDFQWTEEDLRTL